MIGVAITVIAAVVAALFVLAWPHERRVRVAIAVVAWVAIAWAAAASGLLARFDARPPPLGIFMAVVIVGSIAFARSRLADPLLERPLAWLVAFHAFRLPLELVLHQAGQDGLAPTALTFAGLNFDIITGITAIVVAPLASRRRLVFAWNVLGLGLLAVIGAIAIATAPFVRALGDDQVNSWVARTPYVLLPAVLVSAALIGHVLVFRKLASRQ